MKAAAEEDIMSTEEYFETEAPVVTDAQLKTIANLAQRQVTLEARIEDLSNQLKELNKEHRQVSEIDLPEAMTETGMEKFTLSNGTSIEVSETLYASFPKKADKRSEAIRWLMDNDLEAIIKEDVSIPFDKGDHAKVQNLINVLEANGISTYQVNETVNTGTVKSTIKELLEKGVDVPLKLLGGYFVKKAEVKK
jgi:hypothetical protein